ncbi:asparagine synthase (glutamine-hydrolyzing) [candidate division KSB1 bacterium]|nr:asparagine synthase (glutamine-hydrolyzing) [candidate division KSB1 bacterium]
MCGICGVVYLDRGRSVGSEMLRGMSHTLTHRGPDDEGLFIDRNVGLGMRRLAIIDVSGGQQPIANEDNSKQIIFNGEIYNHLDLRESLVSNGHRFKTRTDTEAILHNYEKRGAACVQDLNGMFAFAIWDSERQSLLLTRDRLGIKPLYYYVDGEKFIFGSEIKAILACDDVDLTLDYQAIYYYLTYLYIPAPYTIYKQIKKLPPGHLLVLKDRILDIKKYWTLSYDVDPGLTVNKCTERIEELIADAVKIRLMSEVPLGAFLSGGIDSSTICNFMMKAGDGQVKTFSIGFPIKGPFNELEYSTLAASHLGTDHHQMVVYPDAVNLFSKIMDYLDEPMGDSSVIPTFLLSEFTRNQVTVALSGDGGDELFAGYERYLVIKSILVYEKLPGSIRDNVFAPLVHNFFKDTQQREGLWAQTKRFMNDFKRGHQETFLRLITNFNSSLIDAYCSPELKEEFKYYDPHELARSYFDGKFLGNPSEPINALLNQETMMYLPDDLLFKVDRMSMAHSLEVRVPLLDHRLVEFAARIPPSLKIKGFSTKYILKKLMSRHLPHKIVYKKKQGFTPPLKEWFRNELRDYIREILLSRTARDRGFFNISGVKRMIDDHIAGRREFHHQLWVLLVLELWCRRYLDS